MRPLHVAAWIEQQTREHSAPAATQRLAALRHLFDWLVVGQVVPANPAASVRGPAHRVKRGETPAPAPAEARAAGQPGCRHAGRAARPGADRPHGLLLRADRRGALHVALAAQQAELDAAEEESLALEPLREEIEGA